jgi:hypothetical protein
VNIAEVDRTKGVVTNVLVSAELINNEPDAPVVYVAYTDSNPAWVGLGWTEETGFEQPPAVTPWADDYLPPEADPNISPEEFELILKKHEETQRGTA